MTVSATRIRRTVLTAGVLLSLCALPGHQRRYCRLRDRRSSDQPHRSRASHHSRGRAAPHLDSSASVKCSHPGPLWKWKGYHTGQDFDAASGTPILASAAGTVTHAGEGGAYGTMAQIRHSPSASTLYAHMSAIYVTQGQQVHTGDVIGLVGSTGNSTGPHLHYEVRNSADDPV